MHIRVWIFLLLPILFASCASSRAQKEHVVSDAPQVEVQDKSGDSTQANHGRYWLR